MKKTINNKKELSGEQHEELLKTLKIRFEKNMNRHIGLAWDKVWRERVVNRTLLGTIKGQMNIFSMTAQWKVRKGAEAYVMTARHT